MQRIQELIGIIKKIISEQDDRLLNIRGGRGYSVGHPYPAKETPQVNLDLGSPGPYQDDDEETTENQPVKISKAFKKE